MNTTKIQVEEIIFTEPITSDSLTTLEKSYFLYMNLSNLVSTIYKEVLQLIPLFRMVWIGIIVLGVTMLLIAWVLKKNPERKKSPWIIGVTGLLMVISSGTQLIVSLF